MDGPTRADTINIITADIGMNNLLAALNDQAFGLTTVKWSPDDFDRILALQTMHALLLVRTCEDVQTPVGFAVFSLVADECEILIIGIIPGWRQRGLGSMLVQEIVKFAGKAGAHQIFLEVREDNKPAISMYKAHDFLSVGRRKHYYHQMDNSFIDAIVMKRLVES